MFYCYLHKDGRISLKKATGVVELSVWPQYPADVFSPEGNWKVRVCVPQKLEKGKIVSEELPDWFLGLEKVDNRVLIKIIEGHCSKIQSLVKIKEVLSPLNPFGLNNKKIFHYPKISRDRVFEVEKVCSDKLGDGWTDLFSRVYQQKGVSCLETDYIVSYAASLVKGWDNYPLQELSDLWEQGAVDFYSRWAKTND
jgi:hypothetical protein